MADRRAEKLKELGVKLTPQRLALLGYLEGNKSHPSAFDIYKGLKKKHPSLSLATVYNTLDLLARNGLLLELPIVKDKINYDPDTSDHDHAYCAACGKIFDVFPDGGAAPAPAPRPALSGDLAGFKVESVRRVYYVTCGSCLGA